MDLVGKHALITGGSRGIGAVIAAELAARGARCTLVADLIARAEDLQGPLDILVSLFAH